MIIINALAIIIIVIIIEWIIDIAVIIIDIIVIIIAVICNHHHCKRNYFNKVSPNFPTNPPYLNMSQQTSHINLLHVQLSC